MIIYTHYEQGLKRLLSVSENHEPFETNNPGLQTDSPGKKWRERFRQTKMTRMSFKRMKKLWKSLSIWEAYKTIL